MFSLAERCIPGSLLARVTTPGTVRGRQRTSEARGVETRDRLGGRRVFPIAVTVKR